MNDTGTNIFTTNIGSDNVHSTVDFPSVTVDRTDNSVFVSWEHAEGFHRTLRGWAIDTQGSPHPGSPLRGQILQTDDAPTGSYGPQLGESATLSNGTNVTVHTEYDIDQGIEVMSSDALSGENSFQINVGDTGFNGRGDRDPQIAALGGGGYVIVWEQVVTTASGLDETIMYAVYDHRSEVVMAPAVLAETGGLGGQTDVVGLKDGGFFVVVQGGGTSTFEGTRFDAAGGRVGDPVLMPDSAGTAFDPQLGLTSDGRILLAWRDGSGDIRKEIWDPRGAVIIADGTEEVITARSTEATSITGSDADERFLGQGFDDTITGGAGNDTLRGGGGGDVLEGGSGLDSIFGDEGSDTIRSLDGDGYDSGYGGSGTDTFDASDRNDDLEIDLGIGRWGALGAPSADLFNIEAVEGGQGNDRIVGFADSSQDTLRGNGGNDTILGSDDAELIGGGPGNDRLEGGGGLDSLIGGFGDDHLIAGLGAEQLDGSPGGSDTLDYSGASGAVQVRLFNNTVISADPVAAGDSIVNFENAIGGSGGDLLTGNHLDNTLAGNGGNDTLFGSDGADVLEGGDGGDYLDGGFGDDSISGGAQNDTLLGAGGNDTLDGGDGTDTLIGGLGDDRLIGNTGAEVLDGSPGGSDTVDYSAATGAVTVRIWNNTVSGDPIAAGDTIRNFENAETGAGDDLIAGNFQDNILTGNGGNDSLYGYAGTDALFGGAGEDLLRGGSGADRLSGGLDRDFLSGGADADVFVFGSVAEAGIGALRDQIMDFETGLDVIDVTGLSAGTFGFLGTAGFTATGGPELRLFETGSGSTLVQFDVNGDGAVEAEVRVANVVGLLAGDFLL